MGFPLFLSEYALWHYGRGIKNFLSQWWTFMWFTLNFFSIPLLLRTLFSPLQKLSDEYKKGLDIGALASTLLVNTIMRFVGALVRLFIIGLGLVMLLIVFISGLLFFAAWLVLPFISVGLLLLGVHGLTQLM